MQANFCSQVGAPPKMVSKTIQALAFLLLISLGFGLPTQQSSGSVTPFRLTQTPGRVVTHVTRDVTLRCEDDVLHQSKLQEISRIRMLKKSPFGWIMISELRDLEHAPRKTLNVSVSGRIGQDVRNTFLQVTWDVATKETYGTYMCEIIGFDKVTHGSAVEVTSEVAIAEENVTTDDLLDALRDLKRQVADVEQRANKYQDKVDFMGSSKPFQAAKTSVDDITSIKKDIDVLHLKISTVANNFTSIIDNFDSLNNHTKFIDETFQSLNDEVKQLKAKLNQMERNSNKTATLAKDVSNVQRDFTSLGAEFKALEKIVEFLTVEMGSLEEKVGNLSGEIVPHRNILLSQSGGSATPSASSAGNTFETFLQNFAKLSSWPDGKFAIPKGKTGCPLDVSFFGNRHMYLQIPHDDTSTIHVPFCESSRETISNRAWPDGAYCVNKVSGLNCPDGLEPGLLDLSEAEAEIHLIQGMSVSTSLGFCCKTSGYSDSPLALPNHSEFTLYRFGGRCQDVEGMDVEETIMGPIDTIAYMPFLVTAGKTPDIDLIGTLLIIHTCRYTTS